MQSMYTIIQLYDKQGKYSKQLFIFGLNYPLLSKNLQHSLFIQKIYVFQSIALSIFYICLSDSIEASLLFLTQHSVDHWVMVNVEKISLDIVRLRPYSHIHISAHTQYCDKRILRHLTFFSNRFLLNNQDKLLLKPFLPWIMI